MVQGGNWSSLQVEQHTNEPIVVGAEGARFRITYCSAALFFAAAIAVEVGQIKDYFLHHIHSAVKYGKGVKKGKV